MMNTTDEKQYTYRALWGMIVIGVLGIVALSKGFNGDIARIAIGGIVILVLGEVALEYYFNRKKE